MRLELPLAEAVGEPLLPYLYVSQSGRFLALTTRDRARVYYFDLAAGGAGRGQADAPPEPVQWHRNGDLRQAPFASCAYALARTGSARAQVRSGPRLAPACGEAQCERVTELAVAPHTVTGGGPAAAGVASTARSAASPPRASVPSLPSPRARSYGRLVWSPDGSQLLFTALDGDQSRVYAIDTDGRTARVSSWTRPRPWTGFPDPAPLSRRAGRADYSQGGTVTPGRGHGMRGARGAADRNGLEPGAAVRHAQRRTARRAGAGGPAPPLHERPDGLLPGRSGNTSTSSSPGR